MDRLVQLGTDRRGAVALEMPFVFSLVMFSLLFPLADVAIAGFQFISGYEATRNLAVYLQYNVPPDVTVANTAGNTWLASLPTSIGGYTINNVQVFCGDTKSLCSSTNSASPKYYTFSTTVTLAPMVVPKSVMCTSSNPNPCTYALGYSERFQ